MNYRLPETDDQKILQEYVKEHLDRNERISASLGLVSCDYAQWVEMIHRNAEIGNEDWGRSLLYLCFDRDRLVGLLSIRYELPQSYVEKYGHIGYGVRPSERNKGYASEMLRHALSICREKGLNEVVLGCFKDNLASAATIRKNGGVLFAENESYKEGKLSQYYLIRLN